MGSRERSIMVDVDGMEIAVPRKKTRADKFPKQSTRSEVECLGMKTFKPSVWQKECLDEIDAHEILFVDSFAGTGKSSIALYYACQQYLADVHKQIVFVRTPAEMGGDRIGFLPGAATMDEKLGMHFESTKALIVDFIGKGKFEADLGKRIHFTIPNFALGHTRNDTIYILDEAQLLQPLILKLLLERIGHNTKTIVLGSSGQLYTTDKGRNALRDARARFFNEDGSKKFDNIGWYKFPIEAVMRADVVKDVIRAYDNE